MVRFLPFLCLSVCILCCGEDIETSSAPGGPASESVASDVTEDLLASSPARATHELTADAGLDGAADTDEPSFPESGELEVEVADLTVKIEPELLERLLEDETAEVADRVKRFYRNNDWETLFLNPHRGSCGVTDYLRFVLATHEMGLDPDDYRFSELIRKTRGQCKVLFFEQDMVFEALEEFLSRDGPPLRPPLFGLSCREDWWLATEDLIALDVLLALSNDRLVQDLSGAGESDGIGNFASSHGVTAEGRVRAAIDSLPDNSRFRARLRAVRKFLPYWAHEGLPVVRKGGKLRKGDYGPRVRELKQRLFLEGYLTDEESRKDMEWFDRATRQAVMEYREAYGLRARSHADKKMVAILNQDAEYYVRHLLWSLSRTIRDKTEYAPTHILVNIPEFMTRLVVDGKVTREHRSIVGFPYKEPGGRTPEMVSTVDYLKFNPVWTPTPYVIKHELEKKLRKDPGFYEDNGFRQRDGRLIQLPGPKNTLGRLVISFENEKNLYLHGTPDLKPFGYADRAMSHGCIRVEDIEVLGVAILEVFGLPEAPKAADIIRSGVERRVFLPEPIPIYLVYDRVRVVDDHRVAILRDPYNLDPQKSQTLDIDPLYRLAKQARKNRQ